MRPRAQIDTTITVVTPWIRRPLLQLIMSDPVKVMQMTCVSSNKLMFLDVQNNHELHEYLLILHPVPRHVDTGQDSLLMGQKGRDPISVPVKKLTCSGEENVFNLSFIPKFKFYTVV